MRQWTQPMMFFVLVLLLSMVITLPATQVIRWMPALSKSFQLGPVSGSIWQGEFSAVKIEAMEFAPLRWSMHVWPMVLGRLQLNLDAPSQSSGFEGQISRSFFGRTVLEDVSLYLPVSQLLGTVVPRPFGAAGHLMGKVHDAQIDKVGIKSLQAVLMWEQATLLTPEPILLGTIKLDLNSPGPYQVMGTISSDKQQVDINLSLELTKDNYKIQGVLKPVTGSQISNETLNSLLGRPNRTGEYRLRFEGSIDQLKAFL